MIKQALVARLAKRVFMAISGLSGTSLATIILIANFFYFVNLISKVQEKISSVSFQNQGQLNLLQAKSGKANLTKPDLTGRVSAEARPVSKPIPAPPIYDGIVKPSTSQKQLWSSLQRQMQDAVVQVFSQVAEFNWLEPYKTPKQSESTGSAFFINSEGELITNAHVVLEAKIVFIQIPSIGKNRFMVDVVGISPDRDLALLKLPQKELQAVKNELKNKKISYLKFGDSDTIFRADKIMALGFPLGQESLKSTTGVVSGRQHINGQYFIQTSAPLNPGNSGGPSVDKFGLVVGVNAASIQNAQNVGYFIPINEVKLFLEQLKTFPEHDSLSLGCNPKLIRKPFLGFLFNNANENLTKFLGNPTPGGLYVVEIYKGSPLFKAGIKAGDMIYKINGYPVDVYGEMNVPWSSEDKVSIIDYVSRLKIGQKITIEYYRKGSKRISSFIFTETERPPIRKMYPGYEKIDYEIISGLVIMPLTLNHILLLAQYSPELVQYADVKKHLEPALVVSHVQLNSPAYCTRCIGPGSLISEINGQKVKTIEQLKTVITKSVKTGYLTIKTSESVFFVIPTADIIENERRLSSIYFYPLSATYLELEKSYKNSQEVEKKKLQNNNIKGIVNEKLLNKLVY